MKEGKEMSTESGSSILESLVNPRSIAIFGASETSMYGKGIINSLRSNNYRGKIFPINPKRDEVLGVKCFKSLNAIEETIDLAVIIIGRNYVLPTLEECAIKKVKGVLIITSGFAEADGEGKELESQIKQFSLERNLPIWGPNCAGFANFKDGVIATLLREEGRETLPGRGGFVSQSGALMMALIGVARDKGLGLNYAISTGNEANLEATDFMEYMLEEPSNKVVAAFVEGFKDVKKFIKITEMALEKEKPLCILKVGRSQLGEKAAASHTGSITGADVAYETIFNEKGVIRAVDTDELIEVAKVCSLTKWPKSDGIALITSSGGLGSLSADLCADHHLNFADMSPETMQKLVALEELLTFGTIANPIDVRGQGIRALDKVLPIVLQDENYGMAVVAMCYSAVGKEANNVATIVRDAILKTGSEKPVFILWVGRKQRLGGTQEIAEGYEILERAGIPVFSEPQKCWKTVRKLLDFRRARERYLGARQEEKLEKSNCAGTVKKWIDGGRGKLVEYDFKRILSLYDIPVTREKVGGSLDEAMQIAADIEYPVALKVMSPEIQHKTEARIIQLSVSNPDELKLAYDNLLRNANQYNPSAHVAGVLVQEMVPRGVEVILGMKRDPQFGPLAMFGLGGIFVEIFRDVSFFFPPINEADAYDLVKKIKGYKILQGARGKKGMDIMALVDTMIKFSHLCIDTSELFEEIDINPLIVGESGHGARVVDALMVPR
jgi:acetate---CoA ligase (ADP-forming)